MRKLAVFAFGLFLLAGQSWAAPENIDIFGVDEPTQQKIYECCSTMLEHYLNQSQRLHLSSTEPREKDLADQLKFEEKIISRVKQIGDFPVVKLSVIYYPGGQKTSFATVDIVKADDIARIPNKKKVVDKTKIVPSQETKKLFKLWQDYNEKNMRLIRENKFDASKTSCPTTHCIWGFNEDELKNTLPQLQQGVKKNKQELLNIIKNSPDNQVRADAVFILANDNHPQELAHLLMDFTDDPSELVRNNVMRVLGAIVAKHTVNDLNLERIIQALNYPYVTDRNKAAYVLFGIIKSNPKIHHQVIRQAGNTLLELLKLKQPNNHDFAYHILKEISHKNYGEHDYVSWSKWINEQQKDRVITKKALA